MSLPRALARTRTLLLVTAMLLAREALPAEPRGPDNPGPREEQPPSPPPPPPREEEAGGGQENAGERAQSEGEEEEVKGHSGGDGAEEEKEEGYCVDGVEVYIAMVYTHTHTRAHTHAKLHEVVACSCTYYHMHREPAHASTYCLPRNYIVQHAFTYTNVHRKKLVSELWVGVLSLARLG